MNTSFGVDPASVQAMLSQASSLSDTVSSVGEAVSQGNDILDTATSLAGDASGGEGYAGVAAAAQGLVSDLPPGEVTSLLSDVVGVAAGAASGAAMGAMFASVIPIPGVAQVLGGEIGAAVGAGIAITKDAWPILEKDHFNPIKVIGDVLSMVGDIFHEPDPVQPDYRFLSEKIVFSAVPNGTPFSVVPGEMDWNPRCNPNSTFYQLPSGPNAAPSRQYNFQVSWRSPANGSSWSKQAGWLLAQFYCKAFSTRLKRDVSQVPTWASVVAFWKTGGHTEQDAKNAIASVFRWYGNPAAFDTTFPFANTQGKPVVTNTTANVEEMLGEFKRYPLDFLYYPIPSFYDHGQKIFVPSTKANESDVMLTPDTSLCAVCEWAALKLSDLAAFHNALQLAHFWKQARIVDKTKGKLGVASENHAPLSRIVGYTSAAARRQIAPVIQKNRARRGLPPAAHPVHDAAVHNAAVQTARKHLASPRSSGTVKGTHDLSPWLLLGGLTLGGGGLYLATRTTHR